MKIRMKYPLVIMPQVSNSALKVAIIYLTPVNYFDFIYQSTAWPAKQLLLTPPTDGSDERHLYLQATVYQLLCILKLAL